MSPHYALVYPVCRFLWGSKVIWSRTCLILSPVPPDSHGLCRAFGDPQTIQHAIQKFQENEDVTAALNDGYLGQQNL